MTRATRARPERIERLLDVLEGDLKLMREHPGSGSTFYGVKIPGWSGSLASACDMVGRLQEAVFVDCPKSECKECHGANPHKCKAWEVE